MMINLQDVTLYYENFKERLTALQNINLTINSGERIVIIGPSGCGKSSILYLVAGLLKPSKGTISINNKLVTSTSEDIALILQNHGLFPWKTVLENAELALTLRKVPKKIRRERVLNILSDLGLNKHLKKYPTQLSGGQAQRVAITRALALEPSFLLMDEPFSALDALTREQLQSLILRLWKEREMTLLLVTHSIEEAVYLGQKIVIMSSQPGKIIKIINNENSGDKLYRKSPEFYTKCSYIRSILEGELG